MRAALHLLVLPLRAPMLLVLLLLGIYLGLHWTDVQPVLLAQAGTPKDELLAGPAFWPLQCLQAVLVVVICTMPDLLLRELSLLMASSKALTLVVTLLAVITGGLYLLHLAVFSEVLVLASAVLLVRLDLVRLRMVPPPVVTALGLSVWILLGIALGHGLHDSLGAYVD